MMSLVRKDGGMRSPHAHVKAARAATLAKLRNKEWLAMEIKTKPISQIAKEIDIETTTIYRFVSSHELQLPSKRTPNENAYRLDDKEWLANELKTKSGRKIALELGINNATVNQRILRHGLRSPLKRKPAPGEQTNKKSLLVWFEERYGKGFHNWY